MIQQKRAKKQKHSENQCTIEWDCCSAEIWDEYFQKIKRSTLLQSIPYGRAISTLNHQNIRRGIIKINGKEAGLVQILEVGIFKNAIHAILVDRAPLWFEGFGSLDDFKQFLHEFSKQFPKRLGRRIRILPEIENSASAHKIMHDFGYKQRYAGGYQTVWMDLRPDLDVLRKKLNAKWRNKLKNAEKQSIKTIWSDEGHNFAWLMTQYAQDKAARKYDGASLKTLVKLAAEFSRGKNLLIGTALLEDKPIAAILIFNHGSSATYQIGYTSEAGREARAHHLLLWEAISVLKERNIHDFDLGGVNDDSAKGVKTFKEGLGGKTIETLGLYS